MAIFMIYKNFDFLIPDAPELISTFMVTVRPPSSLPLHLHDPSRLARRKLIFSLRSRNPTLRLSEMPSSCYKLPHQLERSTTSSPSTKTSLDSMK